MTIPGQVWLAPMTGLTDRPFRELAGRLDVAYAPTEMIACDQARDRRVDVARRAQLASNPAVRVTQLVGKDPHWMAEGARACVDQGAQIIDINFGCPSRMVTGSLSGSALLRDLDLAVRLIDAVVAAVDVPVTIKTRLGWDDATLNAAAFAIRARDAGVRAITLHARTRCQFYKGKARWDQVAEVRDAVALPLIINGDIVDPASARQALAQSGADAVMVGRAAIGNPWILGQIEAGLQGRVVVRPSVREVLDTMILHLEASLEFYGPGLGGAGLGLKVWRKHLRAYLETLETGLGLASAAGQSPHLCRIDDPLALQHAIADLAADLELERAA